jgi:hypothetical protein
MTKTNSSINLVELLPYGSFPVGGFREITADMKTIVTSFSKPETDTAIFWFDLEDVEVA